jgi:hypothetical protein
MEVAHPAELVYADEIVVSLQVVLLEASSDWWYWLSALSFAVAAVKVNHFERIQPSFTYQIQNKSNRNHTISMLFGQVSGQVDIINMEDGMDLISFHFHLILNRWKWQAQDRIISAHLL